MGHANLWKGNSPRAFCGDGGDDKLSTDRRTD